MGYNKEYYEKHKEKFKEYTYKYRKNHKEHMKELNKKYRKNKKDKYFEIKEERDKYKIVLDKIKDFIEEFNKNVSYLRWNEDDYVDYIKKIEELLEEIE